jgi:hypothetical protein
MEIDYNLIRSNAKQLGIQNTFKNPNLSFAFDVMCAVLNELSTNVHAPKLFNKRVLSKRDNQKEYLKALINFAQQ